MLTGNEVIRLFPLGTLSDQKSDLFPKAEGNNRPCSGHSQAQGGIDVHVYQLPNYASQYVFYNTARS